MGAGDDLCKRGARGVLCNTCASGHYLDRFERRCVRCAGAAGVTTFVVLLVALCAVLGYGVWRAARAAERRPELWNAIEWWFQALVLFWYFGQTFTTFMRVESVRLVPPVWGGDGRGYGEGPIEAVMGRWEGGGSTQGRMLTELGCE